MSTALVPLRWLLTAEEEATLRSREWGTVDDRVARGVAFLDRTQPGWRDRVSIGELDLASPCNCVLGQVFSTPAYEQSDRMPDRRGFGFLRSTGYDYAVDEFFAKIEDAEPDYDDEHAVYRDDVSVFLGFDHDGGETYAPLQAAWLAVLG